MAWSKDKPAGDTQFPPSDDMIRENWAALEDALARFHVFPGTMGVDAGNPKAGAARVYYDTETNLSGVLTPLDGTLYVATDTKRLYVRVSGAWVDIAKVGGALKVHGLLTAMLGLSVGESGNAQNATVWGSATIKGDLTVDGATTLGTAALSIPWTTIVPINGWVAYTDPPPPNIADYTPKYCKHLGVVYLSGAVSRASITNLECFQLPVGCRPASSIFFAGTSAIGWAYNGEITADGKIRGDSAYAGVNYLNLNYMHSFPAEQ